MDIQSSIVKAFATFLLLSYVKLLNATVDILLPTVAYNVHEDGMSTMMLPINTLAKNIFHMLS